MYTRFQKSDMNFANSFYFQNPIFKTLLYGYLEIMLVLLKGSPNYILLNAQYALFYS